MMEARCVAAYAHSEFAAGGNIRRCEALSQRPDPQGMQIPSEPFRSH